MLALACDHRIMASGKARISLDEITFGPSVFAGSVEMLRWLVGERNVERILLTGGMYSAEEAQRLGLVDEVAEEIHLLERAGKAAGDLARNDPAAFKSIKWLLRKPIADKMTAGEESSISRTATLCCGHGGKQIASVKAELYTAKHYVLATSPAPRMTKMDSHRFLTGYSGLSLRVLGPLSRTSRGDFPLMVAHFKLNSDISALFPYINAVAEDAVFHERPVYIKFNLDGVLCGLHPMDGSAGLFENTLQAHEFVERLTAFLNELHQRKGSIRPNPRRHGHVPVLEIFGLLPGSNCGDCGYPTCMAFAAALSRQEADPTQCTGLGQPLRQHAVYPVYDARGNIERTVAIDIDAGRALNEKQAHIAKLERELARLTRIDRSSGDRANGSLPAPLTERELQVLRLMARGASNIEISNLLQISPHTVKSHVIHIFNKLGVDDRTEASVWAARHSMV
jgi:DNA-binding CsgD family transcriptional regulator/ArsR family metal-binding transcriptional regulator